MASEYAQSPLGMLIREIEALPLAERRRNAATAWRARIYHAASQEAENRAHSDYDPAGDARFQWLCEWADILAGSRRRHTYELEATLRFLFMAPTEFVSGKDLAAGERPESPTLTLTQGS